MSPFPRASRRWTLLRDLPAMAAVLLASWHAVAAEPAYPARPVKLIVPFAVGSTADTVARMLGERLSSRLGQPFVVENKSGAGGVVGTEAVAKAPADGYTLLVTTSSTLVINPSLYKNLRYSVEHELAPVALLGTLPAVLVATPSLPVNSVAELVAYARKNPGKLSYASNGTGSYAHVMMELLKSASGLQIEHVSYRGGNQADPDLLSGNVHLMFNSLSASSSLVAAGRLKGLAVSSAARSPLMSSVPGMGESGVDELKGYDVSYWVALMAPGGTPAPTLRVLSSETAAWLDGATTREQLAAKKIARANPASPAEIAALIRVETDRWAKVLKDAKVDRLTD